MYCCRFSFNVASGVNNGLQLLKAKYRRVWIVHWVKEAVEFWHGCDIKLAVHGVKPVEQRLSDLRLVKKLVRASENIFHGGEMFWGV